MRDSVFKQPCEPSPPTSTRTRTFMAHSAVHSAILSRYAQQTVGRNTTVAFKSNWWAPMGLKTVPERVSRTSHTHTHMPKICWNPDCSLMEESKIEEAKLNSILRRCSSCKEARYCSRSRSTETPRHQHTHLYTTMWIQGVSSEALEGRGAQGRMYSVHFNPRVSVSPFDCFREGHDIPVNLYSIQVLPSQYLQCSHWRQGGAEVYVRPSSESPSWGRFHINRFMHDISL